MLPHKRLIPTSGFSSYLAAHNVVGNMRNWKQMDSRLSPNRPTINRRCHSSQGMVVNTLSSDRSWRPSQNRIYSNSTRSQRAPIIFKARIPNGPKWSPKSDPERSLLASRAASYPSILSTPTLTRQPTVQYQPANEPSLVVCKSVTGSKRREDIQCTSQRTIVKYDDRYGTTEEEVQGGATIDTVSIPSFTLNSASINVYHAVRTFVEEGVEAHLAENGGEVKEERLPRPLPGTTERVVATQSRMVVPESHGEMLTAKRLVTVVPIDNRAMQPKNPIEKGSNRNTDRVANRPFDQALYPHFEEVEFYARQLLSKPTYYSKAQGFSRTTLIDQELPISESNHIEFVQGLEDENESGISTTHPLGHPPAAFVSVSDVPKPVYPLSETQTSTLEALSPLASTDRVDVHEESSQLEDVDASDESLHGPLGFQIPKAKLREIRQDSLQGTETLWQYTLYRGPGCKKVEVHYSLSKDDSERIARLFLDQEVIGFDIEWNQYASASDGLRENVALVQLASEERIALFHIARYSAGDAPEDLVAPTLQRIMESQDITKAGVAIKADCTRLRRYMRIDSRGLLELSHLYKLVKYSTGDVKNINKKLVKLAQQVEEHLKLPLWKGEVRCSDWTKKLDHKQIEYAASDSYAVLQLFYALEGKRKALSPSPPRPRHAELNLPIQLANNKTISTDDEPLEVSDEDPSAASSDMSPCIEETACKFLNLAIQDSAASKPISKTPKTKPDTPSTLESRPELIAANEWIIKWRDALDPTYKPRATPRELRAYALWHEQLLGVTTAASVLRDPPLQDATVACYILESLIKEELPFLDERIKEVLSCIHPSYRAKYGYLLRGIGINISW